MSEIFENLESFSVSRSNTVSRSNSVSSKPKEKLKPSEKFLKDLESLGFDLSQLGAVLATRGNQLVISCAGSGKTTMLVFKLQYDIKTGYATRVIDTNCGSIRVPEKIWVGTFLKSGADSFIPTLRKWQIRLKSRDISSAVVSSTLDAEFYRTLTDMGYTVAIISNSDNNKYLKTVLSTFGVSNTNGKLNSDDIQNIRSALDCTRSRLEDRYSQKVYDEYNLGPTVIEGILREWKGYRMKAGVMDYIDMAELLYRLCYEVCDTDVINYISSKYNFIYLDEFQDTSEIQYALLKVYARGCKQVVVAGDDDQTIYSWRGSNNSIMVEQFAKDFNPVINTLSINFRCPSVILNAIKPCIANNKDRFDKDLIAHKEGGKFYLGASKSYVEMLSKLATAVERDVNNGKSVAILCRTNIDGVLPALALDKLGIKYSVSGEDMVLLSSYVGKQAFAILKLFTDRYSNYVKTALKMLSWDEYGINRLLARCKANGVSLWEIPEKDLSYSCPDIAERVLTWKAIREQQGDMFALRYALQDYRTNVFTRDTSFHSVMRNILLALESMAELSKYGCVEDFEEELEEISERLLARLKANTRVKIATVHEFKGKEADSVYVWNASYGVFPSSNAETNSDFEEERRIFYIANTRARETNTLLYLEKIPSKYLGEMDLSEAIPLDLGGNSLEKSKTVLEQEGNMRLLLNKNK